MVERIALSAVILVGVFAVFLGVPRYMTDGNGWPDVLGELESLAQTWLGKSVVLDWAIALVGVVFLGLSVSLFGGGDLIEGPTVLGWGLLVVGFLALYVGSYINIRRKGMSSAEATLIGSSLVGVVLLIAVLAVLLAI